MLLEYDSFDVIKINIIDSLNNTISTTENDGGLKNEDNESDTTTMIIIIVICILIVIISKNSKIKMKKLNKILKRQKDIIITIQTLR